MMSERELNVPSSNPDYRDPDYVVWTCKIGVPRSVSVTLLPGSDAPMREAARRAFLEVTGVDDTFCFSGWAGALTASEAEVIERGPA